MKKRMTFMLLALAIVFGGIIAYNIIKTTMIAKFFASYQPPAVSVSSAIAKAVNWQPTISTVGTFVALNGVDISSQVAGNVIKISFESGQYVLKDAPLITLDDSVDQALLKFNQADLVLKDLNFKRQAELLKTGATPSSSVDEAKANLQQAQAKVEQTQAQINQKHILAPFDGNAGIRRVNLGEYVTPGKTIVVSLQSLDPLYLEFYLPEQLYKLIKINQTLSFSVDEFPTILFQGKITALNSKVDLNTHNVLIQAILPNCPVAGITNPLKSSLVKTSKEKSGSKLIVTCNSDLNKKNIITKYVFIPGMFASIQIPQPPHPKTVVVPSTAVSYSLYGNSVYIIEQQKESKKNPSQNDKSNKVRSIVKRIFVTTGDQQGNFTVIKKGIKAGQLVVSTGDIKLQNNAEVVINNDFLLNDVTNPDDLGQ
ncbi:MAG: efflux RND transporter periplasmic adaptor subunit [Legionella sp.]|nr:efflux RND transporter periplasmic adaptor subunit [Legionella sp.]